MILTPYQTRAGRVYDTDTIIQAIRKVMALDMSALSPKLFPGEDLPEGLYFITNKTPDVPGFLHPVIDPDKRWMLFVDARPYVGVTPDGSWKIRSQNDFQALVNRAILSQKWNSGEFTDFLALGELPLKLYLNWVGSMVGRHLAIDPMTQFRVSALAGVYYLSQHYEVEDLKQERLMLKICDKVSRVMRASIEEVSALVMGRPPINTLEAFVIALQERTESVRLNDVSVAYLFNTLGGSWWGNNARELTAMAVDYPPFWISLVYQAIEDRSYRKTQLTQTAQTLTRAQEQKDFIRMVKQLLKG